MERLKKFCIWVLVFGMVLVPVFGVIWQTPLNADADISSKKINPFSISGTDIEAGISEFTISVQAVTPVTLSSFDISVMYDHTVLEVMEKEDGGYSFTEEFSQYYADGYLSCNDNLHGKLVLAGIKLNAGEYTGSVAQVTFRVKDAPKAATSIQLSVGSVGSEGSQGIEEQTYEAMTLDYLIVLNKAELETGDVDFDGAVDLIDVQLALQAYLEMVTLRSEQIFAADTNQDGEVDLQDVQTILKIYLNI